MDKKKIAVLIGSLKKDSLNRKMAHNLIKLAPPSLYLEIVEIKDLPLYNEDLETANPPEPWLNVRNKIRPYDGVLFVTPEYNRSVPAALKNALDVGSRPYGQSVWNGKPGAVMSLSPGAIGGFGANHHLRQSFSFLNIPVMQQPEAYVGNAAGLFDAEGEFVHPETKDFAAAFMNAYAAWVEQITA